MTAEAILPFKQGESVVGKYQPFLDMLKALQSMKVGNTPQRFLRNSVDPMAGIPFGKDIPELWSHAINNNPRSLANLMRSYKNEVKAGKQVLTDPEEGQFTKRELERFTPDEILARSADDMVNQTFFSSDGTEDVLPALARMFKNYFDPNLSSALDQFGSPRQLSPESLQQLAPFLSPKSGLDLGAHTILRPDELSHILLKYR